MFENVEWFKDYHIHLSTVAETIGLVVGAFIVIFLLNRIMRKWLYPAGVRVGLPSDIMLSFARFVSFLLWFVALLLVIELWGVSASGLWTLLAGTATIVGVGFLATWAIISNVTSSLFLAIWRPFHLGDIVVLLPENLKGRAVDRNMMFTVLREDDGSVLQIPNNLFFQKIFRVGGH
ncbi:MAG TPA: mechanosensitive ion channel family protein [Xanthobacteraceae bacterium]|nr:mechanosensitive ion channel family protein [Xanthobacteraceae bacterium]